MTERLTDEQLRRWARANDRFNSEEGISMATELIALRAAWRIAEPHLLYPIRRRCLAVLADAPQ